MANNSEHLSKLLARNRQRSKEISEKSKEISEAIEKLVSQLSITKSQVDILITFTDAHSIIIGATELDSALETALLTKLRPLSRDMKDKIFDGYGPLSNFASNTNGIRE